MCSSRLVALSHDCQTGGKLKKLFKTAHKFLRGVQKNITSKEFFMLRSLFWKDKTLICLSTDYIDSLFYSLLMAYCLSDKVKFISSLRLSLHQNVAHGLDVPVSVIYIVHSLVSTRVGVVV